MQKVPVSSSNINAIGYDEQSLTLEVDFKNGGSYQYLGVPPSVHQALMRASSHGKYLESHIKGRYGFNKVG